MKTLTLIGTLFFGMTVFGQKIARENEGLYKEWNTLKLENDSLETLLGAKIEGIKSEISVAKGRMNGTLKTLNYSIESQNYACNKLIDSLKMLGADLSGLEKPQAITNYYALSAELKTAMKAPVKLVSSRGDEEEPLPAKAEQQASVLKERLNREKNVNSQLTNELISIESDSRQLRQFNKVSVNYVSSYSDQLVELKTYFSSLQQKMNAIRTTYAAEGPKGYPIVYRSLFPSLFQDKNSRLWTGGEAGKTGQTVKPAQPVKETITGETVNELITQDELSSPYEEIPDSAAVSPDYIWEIVQKDAEFPGGKSEMTAFLQKNLHYPDFALDNSIGGKCYVRFVIAEDGKISNVIISRGVPFCEECDAEVIRVVSAMPKWVPGMRDGKPVKQWFNLPVSFIP